MIPPLDVGYQWLSYIINILYLNIFEHIWTHLNIFEHIWTYLNKFTYNDHEVERIWNATRCHHLSDGMLKVPYSICSRMTIIDYLLSIPQDFWLSAPMFHYVFLTSPFEVVSNLPCNAASEAHSQWWAWERWQTPNARHTPGHQKSCDDKTLGHKTTNTWWLKQQT